MAEECHTNPEERKKKMSIENLYCQYMKTHF
jgi:hypothetical protein